MEKNYQIVFCFFSFSFLILYYTSNKQCDFSRNTSASVLYCADISSCIFWTDGLDNQERLVNNGSLRKRSILPRPCDSWQGKPCSKSSIKVVHCTLKFIVILPHIEYWCIKSFNNGLTCWDALHFHFFTGINGLCVILDNTSITST